MSYFNTTLKRNSKLDLSRSDLLKLVSMLEGELQAREVVIAVLKSEQIKKLLIPSKCPATTSGFKTTKCLSSYSPPNLVELTPDQTIKYSADPLSALSRDSFAVYEPSFDYSTTLALYNIKMYQLENLINHQTALKESISHQLALLETRYEGNLKELEEERLKNQRKELEYKEFDKAKLESEIKSLTQTLEETKEKEKEMILTLIEERKHLVLKLLEERHQNEELLQNLSSEKGKVAEMVEGLEDESKRSLQMEAELEKYLNDFETERNEYESKIQLSDARNAELMLEVDRLKSTIESLQKQLGGSGKSGAVETEKWNLGEGVRSSIVTMPVSTKVHSSVTTVAHPKASVAQPVTKANPGAIKATATSGPAVESKIILPPPSIPVPQPKQHNSALIKKVSAVTGKGSVASTESCNVINKTDDKPTDNSITTAIITDAPNSADSSKGSSELSKIDNSVKQTVMFYENSAIQHKLPNSSGTSQPAATSSATSTMKKASGARIPPPIPPNKPSIKPVLPPQAILQNKIKDTSLCNKPATSKVANFNNTIVQNIAASNKKT